MLWFLVLLTLIAITPWVMEWRRKPMGDAARQAAPGQFAQLSDGLTHYQWHGPARGGVVVCVHGLTTPSYVWGLIVKGMTMMGFRVLTYDLFGRGYSDRPKRPQDRKFFLRQLRELLADQKVGDIDALIGYSMGGSIATCFAAEETSRVERLILIASAGLGITKSRLAEFVRKTPVIGSWVFMLLAGRRFGSVKAAAFIGENGTELPLAEPTYRGFLPAVLSSQRHMLEVDTSAAHRKIVALKMPVLAIWAKHDTAVPLSAMGRLAEINRKAYQHVVDDADHALPYSHAKDVIVAVQEFLREV